MDTLQLQLFDNIANNEPLAMKCLKNSTREQSEQMRLFKEANDQEHERRIRIPIPERVKLLKQCMQIRDRLNLTAPQDRLEVMRLIVKLDVSKLMEIEQLKKFAR